MKPKREQNTRKETGLNTPIFLIYMCNRIRKHINKLHSHDLGSNYNKVESRTNSVTIPYIFDPLSHITISYPI